ncbi:MAG TPA: hypothetical protein VHA71_06485 [Rhodanobacteraceae bacterium]|jgi:hypothetical protein|nr:hypothetical protein [Rhodanobacteraceae bacterium]
MLYAVIIGFLLTPVLAAAQSPASAAHTIDRALRDKSSVSFYFVFRTEDYDFNEEQVKAEASIYVTRKCGGGCAYFMRPVLAHLRASKPVKCMAGQQNVLITFGAEHITYSYSGRMAKYRGQCYYNQAGIGEVLEHDEFFFR